MADPGLFQEYRAALRDDLSTLLNASNPIFSMLRYHVGWTDEQGRPTAAEGKMLRGVLCLEAAAATGGDYTRSLPGASAVELVHNFSLIHDDIEDASPVRRQRATVWKIWGHPRAINAGDAMLVLAHLALLNPRRHATPQKRLIRALAVLDAACLELCLGQELDLSFETRLGLTIDDYLGMISHKTGALFEASLLLGASLATIDERIIRGLGAFGRDLGLAFQLQDDELGIWGDEAVTGKSATSDIYEKKKSLPIIYALGKAAGAERQRLRDIYQREELGPAEEAVIRQILDSVAARAFTRSVAEKYFRAAQAELDGLGLPPGSTRELRETVLSLLERKA
ncbi:MAG: polyprenyl synthetase family protein [Chloroflexi bacterium]|nr:polyprenyl synthetase family protein [Chloroflexota bacterium]